MTNSLIDKIKKTTDYNEIIQLTLELGKKADEESIKELKNIVQGGERSPEKRLFGFIVSRPSSKYSLEEQLYGIAALGETKKREVLEYLDQLYSPNINIIKKTVNAEDQKQVHKNFVPKECEFEIYDYPHAPLALRKFLNFELQLTTPYPPYKIPKNIIDEKRMNKLTRSKVHQVFDHAIHKLRSSLY